MPTIDELKELEITPTPLFLFDCVLPGGNVERWATHGVTFGGHAYLARVMRHNLFELRSSGEDGLDGAARISVTLANADSRFSQVERGAGFKGARVTIRFAYFDLAAGIAASEARVVFQGVAGAPDEITESSLRVTFSNRFNLQRISLPEIRIQRRCPWMFPADAEQRQEALTGGEKGRYSALYRCGYSADLAGGEGALNSGAPFTSCDYTRANCTERGMFALGRFGGMDFVPAQVLVRSHGEAGSHLSAVFDNQARYNDVVPIVYGTAWYEPPVVFARNDGNLTHMEVLLGMGEIDAVMTVVVNDVEIPEAVTGSDMTATGWYRVVSPGVRNGAQNPDFADGSGNPLGDPYGSMALASIVVPNQISTGQSNPKVRVLLRGLKLEQFDGSGVSLGEQFSANPAWVLLDVLRRSGWLLTELDVASFANTAAYCDEGVDTQDLNGNALVIPRYKCNLVVRSRKSVADLTRGIRAGSALLLGYGSDGRLGLRFEGTLERQHGTKPGGSNSVEELDGGWPAYEFSDGSAGFSGILRRANGEPSLRLYSKSAGELPNRLMVEFQDEFNEYQQDSLSLVDVDDAVLTGRELSAGHSALGLPNYDQATRVLDLQLAKTNQGNTFIEFETSARGIGIVPGDLITVTYLKEGLDRQLFRVNRVAPGANYQTLQITAQWHEDVWYTAMGSAAGGRRRRGAEIGIPRPLVGTEVDAHGVAQFGVSDVVTPLVSGEVAVRVRAAFQTPATPTAASVGVPLVNLTPSIATVGGTLGGGQTLYYAVSGKDSTGAETALSFSVRAKVPSGSPTNAVTLSGLVFSAGTASFNVYRGPSPGQLLRIAEDQAVAGSFVDTGLAPELVGPPDQNYHHANFYWRTELVPETGVEVGTGSSVSNSSLGLGADDYLGAVVRITRGKGAGQERRIAGNTGTVLTVAPAWAVAPDATSFFTVAEGTWKFAGLVATSPAEFEGPRFVGQTIQISGRAANALNRESAFELSPVTRWQIGSGGSSDVDAPPAPVYGLAAVGNGSLELAGIGFTSFANTRGITAGVLDVFSWNELNSPSALTLAGALDDSVTTVTLATAVPTLSVPLIQIEGEILEILDVLSGGTELHVVRGAQGSTAASHASGAAVYPLDRATAVIPFVNGFWGSPASGTFRYTMQLPDARVGVANLYMINAFGNGEVGYAWFGASADHGIRTLSGGQITIQVEGYLATQDSAAPAFVVDRTHAVGEIFAVVREAPSGGDVVLTLRLDEDVYCTLTIPDGETVSNTVSGFGLTPLSVNKQLWLDVTSVPGAPNTLPGRDLTVTLRM